MTGSQCYSCQHFVDHSNSIVPGGLLVSSHMTLVTPSTSFIIFVLTLLRNDLSKLKVSAVMKSVVTTALNATMKPWTLLSPITPTAFIPREAAYAWLIFRYSPA